MNIHSYLKRREYSIDNSKLNIANRVIDEMNLDFEIRNIGNRLLHCRIANIES